MRPVSSFIVLVAAVAVGMVVISTGCEQRRRPRHYNLQPCLWAREAVKGRKASDVKKIVLDTPAFLGRKDITNPEAIRLMIAGLRTAVETELKTPNRAALVEIVWKDGKSSGPLGFSSDNGWKHAFSREFARGYNLVVEPDHAISLDD